MQKTQSRHIVLVFALVMALMLCASMGLSAAGNDNDFSNFTSYSDKDICIAQVKDLGIAEGETLIKTGEAISPDDIVIFNDSMAIGIACGTNDPWGYPAGSVLDVANLTVTGQGASESLKAAFTGGKVETDFDRVWDIQFLMNNWDSWAPSNAGTVTYEVIRYDFATNTEYAIGAENGIPTLKLVKAYTVKGNFTVTTYYSMEAGADRAYMRTKVVNNGAATDPGKPLSSGYSLTHEGDFNDCTFSAGSGSLSGKKYNMYTSAYTEETCCTVALPNSITKCGTSATSGYQDLINSKVYAAGETFYFDGYILMDAQGDTANVMQFFMEKYGEAANAVTIKGSANVEYPVVTVKKTYADETTTTLCWVRGEKDGSYEIKVPALADDESYSILVEKAGYSPVAPATAVKKADFIDKEYTFAKVELTKKETVTFNITDQNGDAIWAKVCTGATPSVRYTGEAVFLGKEAGKVVAEVPQGDYTVTVYGQGANFYGQPVTVKGNSADAAKNVTVTQAAALADGWISADVHHHTCKNDGYSQPQDVMLSQLISGLQVGVVADHDFVSENKTAFDFIEEQDLNMAFYPSVEISCSWAHYCVLPQTTAAYDKLLAGTVHFDQFADYNDIMDSVHAIGATVTQNHPYITYGLAYAYQSGVVPGRYDKDGLLNPKFDYDAYDTVELNGAVLAYGAWATYYDSMMNGPVVNDTMNDWSMYLAGTLDKVHNLVGGSDVHDVLADTTFMSGLTRTVAYVGDVASDLKDRETVGMAFTEAAQAGHSYVTSGPLMNTDKIFGEKYTADGTFDFTAEIDAINGISKIEVYTNKLGATFPKVSQDSRFDYDNAFEVESSVSLSGKAKENYVYNFSSNKLKDGENYWFAIKVTDANGRYAISNPFWVYASGALAAFEEAVEELPALEGLTLDDADAVAAATEAYEELSAKDLEEADEDYVNYYKMAKTMMDGLKDMAKFTDVDNDAWYAPAVAYGVGDGLFAGTGKTTFEPNAKLTRAMFVTILYRFADEPAVSGVSAFTDVPAKAYYAKAVKWASDNKITNGTTDTTFSPNNYVTREQIATFLYRYAEKCGYAFAEDFEHVDIKAFEDNAKISAYAKDAMEWAVSAGLICGKTTTILAPSDLATRAEAAAIFFRLAKDINFLFVQDTTGEAPAFLR